MKRKTGRTVVAGVVLASAIGAAGVARLAGSGDDPAKASAIPTTIPDPHKPPGADVPLRLPELGTFADRGDPAEAALVRAAAPELIKQANLALALPATPAERAAVMGDPAATTRRATALRDVFAEAVTGETIRALEGTLRETIGDPNDEGYSDYRLTIDRWFGIVVDGDRAFAGFHANESYLKPRTNHWSVEPAAPWHVWLQKDGEAWQLVTFRADFSR